MSKQTRAQKRAEEARIIAEMDAAMQEQAQAQQQTDETPTPQKRRSFYDSTTPEQVHCKRCKTLMENGVCPACGFKIYMPMDSEKRDKIKLVTTIVGFAIFFVIFIILQFKKG